jgi:hypothetical protein
MNALGLLGYLGGTKNTQQPGEMGRREELHEHLCRYRQACHYIYTPSVDLVLYLSLSVVLFAVFAANGHTGLACMAVVRSVCKPMTSEEF